MKQLVILRHSLLFTIAVISAFVTNAQILWKISGNGAKESYILGTHHVAPVAILDSIAGFNDAFASCTQLYGEVDMGNMTGEMMVEAQKYMMAPADSMLSKVLTTDEMKDVDAATQKYFHMQASKFDMLKPAALSTQLAVMQAAIIFSGFDPSMQIDAVLQQKAKEKGMAVNGLETVGYQLQMLFGTPISCQVRDLMKMIADEDKYMEYSRILAEAYSRQDLGLMLELMNNPELGMTQYELDTLLYGRNSAWAAQLATILQQEPTFVVVGAGHLPGEKGLLALLRKAGYTVTPVN